MLWHVKGLQISTRAPRWAARLVLFGDKVRAPITRRRLRATDNDRRDASLFVVVPHWHSLARLEYLRQCVAALGELKLDRLTVAVLTNDAASVRDAHIGATGQGF